MKPLPSTKIEYISLKESIDYLDETSKVVIKYFTLNHPAMLTLKTSSCCYGNLYLLSQFLFIIETTIINIDYGNTGKKIYAWVKHMKNHEFVAPEVGHIKIDL